MTDEKFEYFTYVASVHKCTNFWFLKMYYLNILSVSSCKHETGTVAWCGKKIQTQEKGPLC